MADILDRQRFFQDYNVQEEAFETTGLQWDDLEDIYYDHLHNQPNLEPVADFITACLRTVNEVHSLKYRLKDPAHLIEKIIRKKIDSPKREITLDNYKREITDLVGVRALHLFKEDWEAIHDYIKRTWKLHEKPIAYIRKGDSDERTRYFKEKGCKTQEHKHGYRSVHYLVKSQASQALIITEVQVRTIFEEGWSEVDHQLRYPYHTDNELLNELSGILNRSAGSADEMASYMARLKNEWDYVQRAIAHLKRATTHNGNEIVRLRKELNESIDKLKINDQEKRDIQAQLNELSKKQSGDTASSAANNKLDKTASLAADFNAIVGFNKQLPPSSLLGVLLNLRKQEEEEKANPGLQAQKVAGQALRRIVEATENKK